MFCHKCGKELLENADFCSYCGIKIHKPEEVKEPKVEEHHQNVEKSSGKKIYGIITIIIVSLTTIAPSIRKKEFLPLDGIINAIIWFGVLSLISFFIFPKNKTFVDKNTLKNENPETIEQIKKREEELEKQQEEEAVKHQIGTTGTIIAIIIGGILLYGIFKSLN